MYFYYFIKGLAAHIWLIYTHKHIYILMRKEHCNPFFVFMVELMIQICKIRMTSLDLLSIFINSASSGNWQRLMF